MTCSTASDLSLFETLEQKLRADVSVSLLAELERELLRLRCELGGAEWDAFCSEFPRRTVFQILRLGSLTLRRLNQSHFGFPADVLDALMADSIPARPSLTPSPAHLISAWEYSLPASRSMRARKAYFAREIAEVVRTVVQPRILILGAGQMREADDAIHSTHLQPLDFVALEEDKNQADRLRRRYHPHQIRVEDGGWNQLARLAPDLGSFDLIYSLSWLDSTDDEQAALWLGTAVEMLRPGGRVVGANFAPGSRDAGWMEACWNWHPFYRREEDLAQLVLGIGILNPEHLEARAMVRGHAVFCDESGASVFLEVHSL